MLRHRGSSSNHGLPLHTAQPASYYPAAHHFRKNKQRSSSKSSASNNTFCLFLYLFCFVFCLASFLWVLLNRINDSSTQKYRKKYGMDKREHCQDWARNGECERNPEFMLSHCPVSCVHHGGGVSVETMSDKQIYQDAIRGFAYFLHTGDKEKGKCEDKDEDCEQKAQVGKCVEDSEYMLQNCPRSCLVCFGDSTQAVTIDMGVKQQTYHKDAKIREEIEKVIQKTRDYMVNEVYQEEEYQEVRRDCRNLDEYCSTYAAMGECHGTNDAIRMFQHCAPACQACSAIAHYRKCARRPEDMDMLPTGQLHAVFERLVSSSHAPKATVLSRPTGEAIQAGESPLPWILVFDDYLSSDECDWLIQKGAEIGFEQTAEITEEVDIDGAFGNNVGQGRTSLHAWCEDGCEDESVGEKVMDRMLNTTEMKLENTEFMEILMYNEGGHYEEHHDLISTQGLERCGNRILTLYVFLSDVEEGGDLHFTEIEKRVSPKKGRAVLWQNVLDNDFEKPHDLAFHEAMTVTRGKKYGLNVWFHPRNMREAIDDGCCY